MYTSGIIGLVLFLSHLPLRSFVSSASSPAHPGTYIQYNTQPNYYKPIAQTNRQMQRQNMFDETEIDRRQRAGDEAKEVKLKNIIRCLYRITLMNF